MTRARRTLLAGPMATTALKGTPVQTSGELPTVGSKAPAFELVGEGLSPLTSADLPGRVVLNIFPSVDTGVCAQSVRERQVLAHVDDGGVLEAGGLLVELSLIHI